MTHFKVLTPYITVSQSCTDCELIQENTAPHDKLNGVITPTLLCADRGATAQHDLFLFIKVHEHVSVYVCVYVCLTKQPYTSKAAVFLVYHQCLSLCSEILREETSRRKTMV